MSARKIKFTKGEHYHLYNRGIDKRKVFVDKEDLFRFFQSMNEFNTIDPIGSIYENSFRKKGGRLGGDASKLKIKRQGRLVDFVAYCLNPNHYHFILTPLVDNGIEKFMQRLGTGFTMFFNRKYDRAGGLFQKPFKAVHIDTNEYLLHVGAYVNLNSSIHQLGGVASKLSKSSWDEYVGQKGKSAFCKKGIILGQFKNKEEYKKFALSSLKDIRERKDMKKMLLE
jgi:putative transposase